jgi:pimeloyl-ACP methyl ester carboxylesterase
MQRLYVAFLALLFGASVQAAEGFIQIDTERDGAYLPVFEMTRPDATATLILLPGGHAGTGKTADGKPSSGNFLVRIRDNLYQQKFNVLIVFRASDMDTMEYNYRVSTKHVRELEKVIDYASSTFKKPVWLVGTSRGTVSGTAAAIALGNKKVQGLVLTASITNSMQGAISSQAIEGLQMPVLVVHHEQDACSYCRADQAKDIPSYLKASPFKRAYIVNEGFDPRGNVCEAFHWHGFINSETSTANLIAEWIKKPSND